MATRNATPRPTRKLTVMLAGWLFRTANDGVRGAIALAMFVGAVVLAATNPKPGYGLVAIVLTVLSIALFRINFRHTAEPTKSR